MDLLEAVKKSLGISNSNRDDDVLLTIESAKQKLSMIGVNYVYEDDPHTAQAIIMYCRGWYNFQGDGERYMQRFEAMASAMSMASEYDEVNL